MAVCRCCVCGMRKQLLFRNVPRCRPAKMQLRRTVSAKNEGLMLLGTSISIIRILYCIDALRSRPFSRRCYTSNVETNPWCPVAKVMMRMRGKIRFPHLITLRPTSNCNLTLGAESSSVLYDYSVNLTAYCHIYCCLDSFILSPPPRKNVTSGVPMR
jgi:hypothetical protein